MGKAGRPSRRPTRPRAAWALYGATGAWIAACTVGDIDLTGRSCPCTEPYVCDTASNRCVTELPPAAGGGGASVGGSGGEPTGGTAGAGGTTTSGGEGGTGAAGSGGGGATTIFWDDFDGDMASWAVFGEGSWALAAGEMRQTDPAATATFAYLPAFVDLTDYGVESRMRQIEGDLGGAMELVFRVDVGVPQYFYCNYEPNSGQFLFMGTDAETPGGYSIELLDVDIAAIPGYDPAMWVTMVVEVRQTEMHCHLEEIPAATLTLYKNDLPSYGTAGMKVYRMATAYDYFRIYELGP